MINVGSFSGGRTSAYMARLLTELDPAARFVFMETTAEHPLTYKFIRDVVKCFGINLTCLRVVYGELGSGNSYHEISIDELGYNLTAWKGMTKKYGNPSVVSPYCTSRMKTEIHDKWCNETFGKGNYTTWIGIRADETRRAKQKEGIKYLCDISDFSKEDVISWWKTQPFDLGINEHLGNCVFCIKKSIGKLALAIKDEPDLYKQFVECTEGNHVRISGRVHAHKMMYRKSLHLSDIYAMYKDVSRDDIVKRLRGSYDSNSCSESCEIFEMETGK